MQWLTRYFDSLIAPLFKTDDLGRSLYFPAGVWSKGRLLADTVAADRIRMKIRRAYMAFFIGVIPPLAIASPWLTGPRWALIIAVSVIAGLALNAYFFLLARGLPVTDDTLTLGEAYRNQASALGRGWVMTLAIGTGLLAFGSMLCAIFAAGNDRWFGLGGAVLFGAMLTLLLYQLRQLRRSQA